MIPEETTLEQRLEFYEFALENLQTGSGYGFLCHELHSFLQQSKDVSVSDLRRLCPEVCAYSNYDGYSLWDAKGGAAENRKLRIEALENAINDVKSKQSKP